MGVDGGWGRRGGQTGGQTGGGETGGADGGGGGGGRRGGGGDRREGQTGGRRQLRNKDLNRQPDRTPIVMAGQLRDILTNPICRPISGG